MLQVDGANYLETGILPLERTDLSERTYRLLRDRILRRQFKPGEKISVDEIAGSLNVSRTPVTVALRRLAKERLVEIVPQRGTFVTELTARDVTELFDIRLIVELYAADHVLKAGAVSRFLADAEAPIAGMQKAIANDDYGDYESFIANDRDFHLALVKCTGNGHLVDVYNDMNVHIQVARAHYIDGVEKARQAQAEHGIILDAFRQGDAGAIRQALLTHIETVRERILEILRHHGGKL
jgi:DNA-binding GntR family transcriptional regulator